MNPDWFLGTTLHDFVIGPKIGGKMVDTVLPHGTSTQQGVCSAVFSAHLRAHPEVPLALKVQQEYKRKEVGKSVESGYAPNQGGSL